MRQSREATAESRRRILDHAARLFRERGLDGVSVVDVMQAAGMTHGGFYKHFTSKEDLVAEALKTAFAGITERFDEAVQATGARAAAEDYVARYLTLGHVEQPGIGCPVAALGGEICRAGAAARSVYESGVEGLAARLKVGFFQSDADGQSKALALLTMLAGTVMTARGAVSAELRRALLAAGAKAAALELSEA